MTLQGVHDVHGGDGLPLGMLGISDGITDDIFQENFEYSSSFLVDESGDTFHSTSSSQTADGGFGDTLDVISQDFPVTLGAPLSESFSSFTSSGHDCTLFSTEKQDKNG